jgi:hypothetical protein
MYTEYIKFVDSITASGDISSFKSNPIYREILEHVSPEIGHMYYTILKNRYLLSDDAIRSFCQRNDSVGTPIKYTIATLAIPVSPTSLRYLEHAMRTIDHIQSLSIDNVDIVEVGCGYGGYALALDYASRIRNILIRSYTFIDLDEPLRLQARYIDTFEVSFPVRFHSASTYGADIREGSMFLISMYCFSEIDKVHQIGYLKHLFPKIHHGILMWNHISLFDFGKPVILAEPEIPLTGPGNLVVLF